MRLPDFVVRLSALFDPTVRMVTPELGRARAVDSSHVQHVLGLQLHDAEDTIVETARSLIAAGIVRA
jgi:dihydroflavonol-4-reductase